MDSFVEGNFVEGIFVEGNYVVVVLVDKFLVEEEDKFLVDIYGWDDYDVRRIFCFVCDVCFYLFYNNIKILIKKKLKVKLDLYKLKY